MKIRTDFVTNSSSSSFLISLIAVDNKGRSVKIADMYEVDGDECYGRNSFCGFECSDYDLDNGSDYDIEDIENIELRNLIEKKLKSLNEDIIRSDLLSFLCAISKGEQREFKAVKDRIVALFIAEYIKSQGIDISELSHAIIKSQKAGHGECFEMVEQRIPDWDDVMKGKLSDEEYADFYNTDTESIALYRDIKNNMIGMARVTEIHTISFLNGDTKISVTLQEEDDCY